MTEKVFKEYLSENQKEYKYKIKLAVEDVTPRMLDKLEMALSRYSIKSASAFKRTPIQESPLDFPNIKNMPVYISEVVTAYPASRDFLETYISGVLGLSEQAVVVYSENDPREYTTQMHLDVTSEDFKKNYKTKLGDDYYEGDITTEDVENLYGEKQISDFMKEIIASRAERTEEVVESPLSQSTETDNVLPSDYHDFNKDVDKENYGIFGRPPKKPELINKL